MEVGGSSSLKIELLEEEDLAGRGGVREKCREGGRELEERRGKKREGEERNREKKKRGGEKSEDSRRCDLAQRILCRDLPQRDFYTDWH